jgi:hypothetical protein
MGLFGTVSEMIKKASDKDILTTLDATSYKDTTKNLLIERIRNSDKKLTVAKNNYGNGISLKGMIVNISGYHFLKRVNLKQETGKSWSDKYCIQPTANIDPLENCIFFHAKSDAALKGCRGGFTLQILDKNSIKKGTISIAWENPYIGDFVYCCMVSKNQDNLQACLNYCDRASKSKMIGDVTVKISEEELKQLITVNVMADNKSTAYLVIGVKTDDLERAVHGPL